MKRIDMKKTFCFVIAVFFLAEIHAQDIMTQYDTNAYMFNPMPSSLQFVRGKNNNALGLGVLVQQYYSPDTVTIYGVALTIKNISSVRDNPYPYTAPEDNYKVVLMRPNPYPYESNPHHFTSLFQLDAADLTADNVKECFFRYDVNYPTVESYVVECYEVYFNTPMQINRMSDTFYVGRCDWLARHGGYFWPTDNRAQWWHDTPPSKFLYGPNDNHDGFREYSYARGDQSIWGWCFPIIGFHCKGFDERVDPVSLTAIGGYATMVTWDKVDPNATYQVHLTSDTGLDSVVETTDTSMIFRGLPPSTTYNIQVRQACHYATVNYDTTVFSPWAGNLSFTTADSIGISDSTGTGTEGITTAEGVDFGLTPNPTRGEVELVMLSEVTEEGCSLSTVGLDGRERLTVAVPRGTSRLRLDAGKLPSGIYLLKLVSPRGVSVRRLMVL